MAVDEHFDDCTDVDVGLTAEMKWWYIYLLTSLRIEYIYICVRECDTNFMKKWPKL